jgi:hypothetical protein
LETEESASFLKKRSKKRLIPAGLVTVRAKYSCKSKFFASFFQKSAAFFIALCWRCLAGKGW